MLSNIFHQGLSGCLYSQQLTDGIVIADLVKRYQAYREELLINSRAITLGNDDTARIAPQTVCTSDACEVTWKPLKH